MGIAQFALEYLKVMIWPLVVLIVLIRYHKYITKLFDRVIGESEEISSSFLGLRLSAKFRKDISDISAKIEDEGSYIRKSLEKRVRSFANDEFKVVCSYFFSAPIHVRREAAKEIARIATDMTLEDLLDFSDSSMPGEKVGAAIGIRVHIESSPSIAFDQRIIQAIRTLLCDIESRVRFRAVEAIGAGPKLASTFQEELESISRPDSNNIVRKKARELLEQYSG